MMFTSAEGSLRPHCPSASGDAHPRTSVVARLGGSGRPAPRHGQRSPFPSTCGVAARESATRPSTTDNGIATTLGHFIGHATLFTRRSSPEVAITRASAGPSTRWFVIAAPTALPSPSVPAAARPPLARARTACGPSPTWGPSRRSWATACGSRSSCGATTTWRAGARTVASSS